jgi:hypothetical protein
LNACRTDSLVWLIRQYLQRAIVRRIVGKITADSTVILAIFLHHLLKAIGHMLTGMSAIHFLQSHQGILNLASTRSYHVQTTPGNAYPFPDVHPSNERLTLVAVCETMLRTFFECQHGEKLDNDSLPQTRTESCQHRFANCNEVNLSFEGWTLVNGNAFRDVVCVWYDPLEVQFKNACWD